MYRPFKKEDYEGDTDGKNRNADNARSENDDFKKLVHRKRVYIIQ